MQEVLDDLRICRDAAIDEQHRNFNTVCDVAHECLRVLNIDNLDLYNRVLKSSVRDDTLADLVEEIPEVRENLALVTELKSLYEQLRAMKLEGKVYEVLDKFFNEQLYRTL